MIDAGGDGGRDVREKESGERLGGGGNVGGVSHLCAFRWPTLATAAGYDATRCRSFGESLFDLLFFFFFFTTAFRSAKFVSK